MSEATPELPDRPGRTPPVYPPAILLMGPTASGKSALAIEIAQRFGCEIVSVDSAQVYRGMDIGTAKPDAATRTAVAHHLIDVVEPHESYSAARFRDDALTHMREITERGRIPLLAGGTMLYFRALIEGLADLPEADPVIRLVIDTMAETSGWPAVHAELARVDPETAARLAPNDAQRIQRALEIYYVAGRPMTELLRKPKYVYFPYRAIRIALAPGERAVLHERIAVRFEEMLELGLLGELRRLRAQYGLEASMPSMRCVGYRQAWEYLDGAITLGALRDKGIAATRQLAKRQLTWLRSMQELAVFDCLADDLTGQVIGYLEQTLQGGVPQTLPGAELLAAQDGSESGEDGATES
jgi:tRNA dimethylallyltransferase